MKSVIYFHDPFFVIFIRYECCNDCVCVLLQNLAICIIFCNVDYEI